MIKVCYIIGQLNRAGAEKQLYYLARGIDREKFSPVVISLCQGGYWGEELRKLGIPVIEIARKKNREMSRLVQVIRYLKTLRPEIVHTYLFSGNSYGRVAALLCRIPVIIASERNQPELGMDKTAFSLCIDRMLARFTDGIICNTQAAERSLTERYADRRARVFYVPNGIDVHYESAGHYAGARGGGPKVVGTIGCLRPQKNHYLFLDVASELLRKKSSDLSFLLVGDGPLREDLLRYCRTLGIDKTVVFAGERHDIPELLKLMDVFVMTSRYEGMSNTIMEAMLSGLPVVATDVGGNAELIRDGETGFLVPPANTAAMVKSISDLLDRDDNRMRMGAAGRRTIMHDFSMQKMVERTEAIYLSMLGTNNVMQALHASQGAAWNG